LYFQRQIEKRIFCNTFTGCKSWVPPPKRPEVTKRQSPLRLFQELASLEHSERGHGQGTPLLVQDIDSGQAYQADAPRFENRPLPPLVTWLQKRREFENDNEAQTEDGEERFWRIFLTALSSTIKSTQVRQWSISLPPTNNQMYCLKIYLRNKFY